MLLLLLLPLTLCQGSQYSGHAVLRSQPSSSPAAGAALQGGLEALGQGWQLWRGPTHRGAADIMVSPELDGEVRSLLASLGLEVTTWIPDVEELVKKSGPALDYRPDREARIVTDYINHTAINEHIDRVAETHEDTDTFSIGRSLEGRDMRVLAITRAGPDAPSVWVQAGMHAREWVAPPVAMFMIDRLLWHETDLLDKFNIYVLPSANPDGYEYSREEDRMWRKTRSPRPDRWDCSGVDGNRNWPVNHRGDCPTPTVCDKCAEVYPGPEPFSEVEVRNIRDFLLSLPSPPVLTESIHSYSQLWLYPYGYADATFPDNVEEHRTLSQVAVDALRSVHGTEFTPENEAELYIASGTAMDWFCRELGATYCFTTELRDTGNFGFLLPADQIYPSGEEFTAGMVAMLQWIIDN